MLFEIGTHGHFSRINFFFFLRLQGHKVKVLEVPVFFLVLATFIPCI